MTQTPSKGRIFIHHDGALGDTLLSLPCIRLMRGSALSLHIAARKDIADLLLAAGVADEISSPESMFYGSLYEDTPDEAVKTFLSSFNRAFIFTVDACSGIAAAIRRTVYDTRTIVTIPPPGSSMHSGEFRLRQCGFSAEGTAEVQMLHIPWGQERWAAELLRKNGFRHGNDLLVSLHPGSGGKKKCWPWSHYEALIKMITEEPRYFVLVLSGPAEDAETVQLLSELRMQNERIIHLHNEPLIRIASLLTLSDFYIGNDSGISHLAGVLRCRGAVLFGPTNPAIWRPFGDTLAVFRFAPETPSASATAEQLFQRIHRSELTVKKK
jgi:ADP-heptose:LPS heptosyltransferase